MRGMRRTFGALAVVAAATVGFAVGDALATPASQAATIGGASNRHDDNDLQWGWDLAPGKTLEVKGVNGWIHIERATGKRTEVQAVKRWRRSNPDDVHIEVIENENGVTVCAVYPGLFGRRNSCEDGEHINLRNNDVQVEFTLHVAPGVRVLARTVNGEIAGEAVDGPIEARTVNGSIALASSRHVSAQTVNGSVHVDLGTLGKEDLDFKTVNGSVTLSVGGPIDAQLRARTVNGEIESDFPLTIDGGRMSRHHIDATMGRGGPELRIETVNGSVRLRRRGGGASM